MCHRGATDAPRERTEKIQGPTYPEPEAIASTRHRAAGGRHVGDLVRSGRRRGSGHQRGVQRPIPQPVVHRWRRGSCAGVQLLLSRAQSVRGGEADPQDEAGSQGEADWRSSKAPDTSARDAHRQVRYTAWMSDLWHHVFNLGREPPARTDFLRLGESWLGDENRALDMTTEFQRLVPELVQARGCSLNDGNVTAMVPMCGFYEKTKT